MADEKISQNEPEQEEKQSVASVVDDVEESEKESIASAGADDLETEEEEQAVSVEAAKSDVDVNLSEGETADVNLDAEEKTITLNEPADDEFAPEAMFEDDNQEKELPAPEADGEVTETSSAPGEISEEGDGKSEGVSEISDVENKGEGDDKGEAEGKVKGEIQGQVEAVVKAVPTHRKRMSVVRPPPGMQSFSPRPSIVEDPLMFDPAFTTTLMSDFSEQVQMLIRQRPSYMAEQEEEEERSSGIASEETVPEEAVTPPIDRQPYLELHASLAKQRPFLKLKNNFLQRKMAEYFKRRKMEHVLRESDRVGDADAKYFKQLDALWELRNMNNLKREAVTHELNELREMRNNQLDSVAKNFEQMLARERDIGTGLIYTKTAKEIPENFLEQLLKNQKSKSKEIEEMRLAYIRIRDAVNQVQGKIKALDKIGEEFTLIDYEQLKMENQNHADKIEERDEELGKLRMKYSAAIQCLAHFREKSTNTDLEIEEMQDKFEEIETDRNNWREKVNSLKQERDALRTEILKLQECSGLLAKPKLLLDLQDTMDMVVEGKHELDELKEQFAKNTAVLNALKKNADEEKDKQHHVKNFDLKGRKKIAKHRPRLAYPSLERFKIIQFEEQSNADK